MKQPEGTFIARFLRQESSGGIMLVVFAAFAMVLANSPLDEYYSLLIKTPVAVIVGSFEIAKPMLLWVNDGLMAIFFLLVGLELKREILEGELRTPRKVVLPALGALGGMLLPATIYAVMNLDDPRALRGWAIPSATDIAFALGVLSLLGSRVPVSLKVFLTSLAIFDDLGAIIIIAVFYSDQLSGGAFLVVAICIVALWYFNHRGLDEQSLYLVVGAIMWVATLKSGVHATLAGVILAMFIPMKSRGPDQFSPVKRLEHDLHPSVAYLILPIFAFCNAGIDLGGVGIAQMTHSVPLGIALGLFVGKQLGVFGFCWVGIKLGLTELPQGFTMKMLYGASALCGIGFTMSLFISALAFEGSGVDELFNDRLGIMLGSLASGAVGFLILYRALPPAGADKKAGRR
ncbi:MAG: Na+/H+ antiporter NhaA [Proteobacteria bacterium]|nr:Na+/H+ antiporter NhaA [Pseudomonadota bacterium]MDA1302607.1 Na+/H+ antiporter NhaA [Pseudomonadota bacterium]